MDFCFRTNGFQMKPHLILHVRANARPLPALCNLVADLMLHQLSSSPTLLPRVTTRATQIDLQRSETHVRIGSADWIENSSSSVDDKFVSRDRTTIPFDVILRTLTLKSIISVT